MTDNEPILLLPGPLTTPREVKEAMLCDIDPWSVEYGAYTQRLMRRLAALIHAGEEFACLPVPGPGTCGVEAMIGTLIPESGITLCLVNGHYSRQIRDTIVKSGRQVVELAVADGSVATAEMVDAKLGEHPEVTHVSAIHCETVTSALAPLEQIAAVVEDRGRSFLVDAISTFGGVEIDARRMRFDGMVANATKCLESTPGMAFVFCRKSVLRKCAHHSSSLSLDLYRTWRVFEEHNSWRMTPPVQCIAAMEKALDLLDAEGGVAARAARYRRNRDLVVNRLRDYGFTTLVEDAWLSPIIVSFHCPIDEKFDLPDLIKRMRAAGYVFSRGKTEGAVTFRVACIGRITADDLDDFLTLLIGEIDAAGVTDLRPENLRAAS